MTNGIEPVPTGQWPAGHRGALAFVVAVEGPVSSSGDTSPDTGVDYAATGLHRLLVTLEDFDLSVTTAWSESALNTLPQLLRRVADEGHEIAATFAPEEPVSIDSQRVGALKRVSGQQVTGALSMSTTLLGSSDDTGFDWQITGASGDLPIITGGTQDTGTTIQIPTSPYWIDRTWLHPERPLPPSSLLETWSTSLAAIRTEGSLMTVIIHPHIMLRPGFTGTFTRFLDEAIGSGDVWMPRLDQLAQWWVQRQFDN